MSWHTGERPKRRQWAKVRRLVLDRDGWRCQTCGKVWRLECDHIIPLEKGGAVYDLANLQTLCRGCHIAKSRAERMARPPSREVKEWQRYLTVTTT